MSISSLIPQLLIILVFISCSKTEDAALVKVNATNPELVCFAELDPISKLEYETWTIDSLFSIIYMESSVDSKFPSEENNILIKKELVISESEIQLNRLRPSLIVNSEHTQQRFPNYLHYSFVKYKSPYSLIASTTSSQTHSIQVQLSPISDHRAIVHIYKNWTEKGRSRGCGPHRFEAQTFSVHLSRQDIKPCKEKSMVLTYATPTYEDEYFNVIP